MEKRDFEQILKDATRDVLVSMFKDDIAHDLADSCYDHGNVEGMNIKKAIGNVRIEQEYWAGILQVFKEEGLI